MSCPRCQEGSILSGEPKGTIETGLLGNSYFSPAPAAEANTPDVSPKKVILLLTDAFGLPVNNCKIIADELAKKLGCDVWVPDYFMGASSTAGGLDLMIYVHNRKTHPSC